MILRAYKVQLDVNNKQQTLLLQHIGCARWAYNWALAKKKESYTESSSGIQAYGDGSSEKAISLSPSAKQEFNKKSRVYILKA